MNRTSIAMGSLMRSARAIVLRKVIGLRTAETVVDAVAGPVAVEEIAGAAGEVEGLAAVDGIAADGAVRAAGEGTKTLAADFADSTDKNKGHGESRGLLAFRDKGACEKS